eukprot:87059-Pelagomonas_calceolata.AAC.1
MDNQLQRWILNVLRNLPKHYLEASFSKENVAWNLSSSTGFVSLCVSTTHSLNATVYSLRWFSTQTSALAPELTIVGHHTS